MATSEGFRYRQSAGRDFQNYGEKGNVIINMKHHCYSYVWAHNKTLQDYRATALLK